MATIKRADGTIVGTTINEAPIEMEEIITNEEVNEVDPEPEIHVENESDTETESATSEDEKVVKSNITIEAPWWRFYKLIENLFAKDDSVMLLNDETKGIFEITIVSADVCKLAAIKKVIGTERQFGNVKVNINYTEEESALTLDEFVAAFKDTGYLVDTKTAETPTGDPLFFPIMKKDVIQFFDDDISDYYGNFNATVAAATIEVMDPKNLQPNFLVSTEVVPVDNEEE